MHPAGLRPRASSLRTRLALRAIYSLAGLCAASGALIAAAKAETTTNVSVPFEISTARDYLRDLSTKMAGLLPGNNEVVYERAKLASQLGEKKQAEALARQVINNQPGRVDAALFVAELLVREDRMQEAEGLLKDTLKTNPQAAGVQRQLGMVLDRLGKPDEAEKAFEAAKSANPRDPATPLVLGRFLIDHGKVAEAITNLELSCQLDTNSANPYYPLFQAYNKLGNKEAAQSALKRFRELKKVENADTGVMTDVNFDNAAVLRQYTAGIHLKLASLLKNAGSNALAEAHFVEATRIDSNNAEAFGALSDLYVQEGRFEEAAKSLGRLSDLQPTNSWTRLNYGTMLLQTRRYAEGVEQLKKVLEQNPKQAQALYTLSKHYLTTRQSLGAALELTQRLVTIDGGGRNYDLLGWAYYANGRTNEALEAMNQAVAKSPEDQGIRQRYEKLKQVAAKK